MKLFDYLSVLGQSSNEIILAKRVYQIMLDYHLGLIQSEAKKKVKAKAEIEATGKTKLSWDDEVAAKDFVWSIDVVCRENDLDRPSVVEAFKYLQANRFVRRLFLSGQATQCYYIPVETVLGQS